MLLAAQQEVPFFLSSWMPLAVIGVLFYFMLIRPERQRRAETARMLSNIKKNDRVVTGGGIYGTVVNVQKGSEDLTIKVDESNNTKLRVLRSSVSRVVTVDGESGEKQGAN